MIHFVAANLYKNPETAKSFGKNYHPTRLFLIN